MKAAVGGSMLLYIVVFFVTIVMLLFVGILAYSKAYKIKNRIVEVIEKHEKYDEIVADELTGDLSRAGYIIATQDQINAKCDDGNLSVVSGANHLYCVYVENQGSGNLYNVETYIHFEFPIIGDILTFKVKGQTKILGKDYNY